MKTDNFQNNRELVHYGRALAIIMLSVAMFFDPIEGNLLDKLSAPKILVPFLFLIIVLGQNGKLHIAQNSYSYLFFVIFSTSSFFLSDNFLTVFLSLLGYFILLVAVINIVKSDYDVYFILRFYVWGIFFVSLLCCLDYFFPASISLLLNKNLVEDWYGVSVFLGFENNPNGLASFLSPAIPLTFLGILRNRMFLKKISHFFMGSVICFALIMTHSRSGALGASVGMFCIIYFYYHKTSFWSTFAKILTVILLTIFVYILFTWNSMLISLDPLKNSNGVLSVESNKSQSIFIRLVTLPYFLQAAIENPIFGVGFGQAKEHVGQLTGYAVGPHNIFLGVLVEFGIFAFIALIFAVIRPLWQMHLNLSNLRRLKDVHLARLMIYAGFLAIFVHGMFHEIYVNFSFWVFIALICASNRTSYARITEKRHAS